MLLNVSENVILPCTITLGLGRGTEVNINTHIHQDGMWAFRSKLL